jgi:hypothetical protein
MVCVTYSVNKYLQSHDPHSQIVRAIDPQGNKVDHWYFRSQEYIASTQFGIFLRNKNMNVPAYEGPIQDIPKTYKECFARFEPAYEELLIARALKEKGVKEISSLVDAITELL